MNTSDAIYKLIEQIYNQDYRLKVQDFVLNEIKMLANKSITIESDKVLDLLKMLDKE